MHGAIVNSILKMSIVRFAYASIGVVKEIAASNEEWADIR